MGPLPFKFKPSFNPRTNLHKSYIKIFTATLVFMHQKLDGDFNKKVDSYPKTHIWTNQLSYFFKVQELKNLVKITHLAPVQLGSWYNLHYNLWVSHTHIHIKISYCYTLVLKFSLGFPFFQTGHTTDQSNTSKQHSYLGLNCFVLYKWKIIIHFKFVTYLCIYLIHVQKFMFALKYLT